MAPPEIQFCHVLRCVVIGVILFAAATTLEGFAVAVLIMDEPTLVAPLGCVPWVDCIHEQPFVLGFVLNEIPELAERPFGVPLCERQVFTDVAEVFEDNPSAVMVKSFFNNPVRYTVQDVLYIPLFAAR